MATESKNTKPFYNTELPSDWEVVMSGKVIKYFGGNAFSSDDACQSGIRWLKIANVGIETTKWDEASYLPEEFKTNNKKYLLEEGDIVMALTRPILDSKLKVAKIKKEDTPCLLNQRVAKLITQKNLHDFYAYHVIQMPYFINRMNVAMAGTDPPNLGSGDLEKIKIPLPPLPEQKAIAKVLNTADSAIHATEKLIAQKELRKKWLMQQLLTGKKRLKGFEGEWMEYHFEKLLKVVKRPVKWDDNELYKLISVRRRSGGIFFREALYGHQIKVKDLRDAAVGDFLFSKMQIVHGASALVTKDFEGAKISGSYVATVAKEPNLLNMEYFNWYSQLPYFYHQALISSYGVHIEKMTFDFETFLQLEMKLPSFEEQTAITQVLQTADKEIRLLKAKAEKLREQKKGLMQVLLTGKMRLKF
jgi:type I restriction enzyme S subunit